MDIVTHALLGALAAASVTNNGRCKSAALAGGISALLPDMDVLIRSAQDPLLVLEYHRHFTHSLFFAPLGAAVGMLLLWPFLRKCLNVRLLYAACLAGYASACLLDVCTSYGTHLFWPVYPQPIALGIIAVVDPLFTLLLIIGLAFYLCRSNSRLRWFGAVAASLYLCFGALQWHRAHEAVSEWVQRNHTGTPEAALSQILVKPTLGNLVLWRALIIQNGQVQALSLRIGVFGQIVEYTGERTGLIDLQAWHRRLGDSRAYQDLLRFNKFADGLLVPFPGNAHHIGDVRYAMLPTSIEPLWGIEVSEQHPNDPVRFFTRRDTRPEIRTAFLQMLWGRSAQEHD